MLPLAIVLSGLAVISTVLLARHLEAGTWRRNLTAYRLTWPSSIDEKQLSGWFTALAAITHRPGWSLLPLPPIGLETIASSAGIAHVLLVSEGNKGAVLSSLRAVVPGVRLTEIEDYQRPAMTHALELAITTSERPLASDRAAATSAALLASLQPIPKGAGVVLQTVLTSAGTPSPVKQADARGSGNPGLAWFVEGEQPIDAEAVAQLRRKYEQPLLSAVLRVGVTGVDQRRGQALVGRTWSALRAMNAPGVRVVRRYLPSKMVARRLTTIRTPLLKWPLLLNSSELVGVTGLPASSLFLPGLQLGGVRQLPAPAALPRRGLIVGTSNYPGMTDRPLALSTTDRLRHSYFVGPTGSGKSNLIGSAVLQDIAAGRGVCVVDVKGDLIQEILARIAPADEARLLVINPSDRAWPVGLNVLQHAHDEATRELAVDNVLHVFREIWRGFWGPRTDWIMRSALQTLTMGSSESGEPLTLVELSPLLTNAGFRSALLNRTTLPPDVRAFWQRYGAMSESERTSVIGPSLNKIDAFTSRTPIRLMLGQGSGVDLRSIFSEQRIVLVSLDKGQLGAETTNLLGALTVASLWQATLAQAAVPMSRRKPAFAYLDEAQDIVRLEVSMADMLAQSRGYGLGIVLANQYVAQLPESVRAAILGTVRTTLAFQVDYDDARLLERRFAPLTKEDLQHLGQYEIALRPSVGGQTLSPITGVTLPLPEATRRPREVAARSAARWGKKRADVEAAMAERLVTKQASSSRGFGRQRLDEDQP